MLSFVFSNPLSSLSGAFHYAATSGGGEKRPVLDCDGFFSSIACVAMLVFEGDDELTPREKVGMFLSSIDAEKRFVNWEQPVLVGVQVEEVLWEVFQKYVSVKDKSRGAEHGFLTSMGYAKFVKEFGILKGLSFAMGKSDTVFKEVVMKRAHRVVQGLGGGKGRGDIGGGGRVGSHANNSSKMSFEDFILSLCGLGRLRERGLSAVEDCEVVKLMYGEIIRR